MNNRSQSLLEMKRLRLESILGTNGPWWIAIQHRNALPDYQRLWPLEFFCFGRQSL